MLKKVTPAIWMLLAILGFAATATAQDEAATPSPIFVRVTLTSPDPAQTTWRVHVIAHPTRSTTVQRFVGVNIAEQAGDVQLLEGQAQTPWIDLSDVIDQDVRQDQWTDGIAAVRFLFEPAEAFQGAGVEATFDFATATEEEAIVRSVSEHDPGNLIAFRIPPDLVGQQEWLLSIREDTQRRLEQAQGFVADLPEGPLPEKIWTMTGFRSNGQFYTDPAIARMDFDIIKILGMNGYWEQNGGQPGPLREMAQERDINRSTVYWRAVYSPPIDPELNAVRLDWDALEAFLDNVYQRAAQSNHQRHDGNAPTIIADLMDEPAGRTFDGPEYHEQFRQYLQRQGLEPSFFGKESWEQVEALRLGWRSFFETRGGLDLSTPEARRLFYWQTRFWNHVNARMYSLATRKVEKYAPGVETRVNFGPPWWYDYGHLPRGIDAYEFGRLRGVTLGFNEDWIGEGHPRWPLEINTYLTDFSRAAAAPRRPLVGNYLTRDADRATVKLRALGMLARETKVFDFYYYGPAYTFFDHWSDNASMVQGVAELTRDLGQVDDLLWEGRAPQAEVALLYSRSWPVWKKNDTEQVEVMMTYLALLHAGIPVDLVWDEAIADGRFDAKRYKALYMVNESVKADALREIERWVRDGGHLWMAGWAGMNDEYNNRTQVLDEMLGLTERSWEPAGDLDRYDEPIEPADWQRPYFGREVALQFAEGAQAQQVEIDGLASVMRVEHGSGLVQVVPWAAGKAYIDGVEQKDGSLASAILYPDDARRDVIAQFALDAGVEPPAVTDASQILAWPLWTQHNGLVLLANFTGEPAENVTVRFTAPVPVSQVRSLQHGELETQTLEDGQIQVSVPMPEVTDILVVE